MAKRRLVSTAVRRCVVTTTFHCEHRGGGGPCREWHRGGPGGDCTASCHDAQALRLLEAPLLDTREQAAAWWRELRRTTCPNAGLADVLRRLHLMRERYRNAVEACGAAELDCLQELFACAMRVGDPSLRDPGACLDAMERGILWEEM